MEITEKTLIAEAVKQDMAIAELLFESGIHCLGCHLSAMETIEQGLAAHGMSEKQIEEIVRKMNEILREKDQFRKSGKMILVTKSAHAELGKLAKKHAKNNYIRIRASKEKSGEVDYEFDLDAKKTSKDKVIEEGELKFLVDSGAVNLVKGTRIDFKVNEGFSIDNPNQK